MKGLKHPPQGRDSLKLLHSGRSMWKEALKSFKSKPVSHLSSFLILHEASALIPIPIIYLGLSSFDARIPFPSDLLVMANEKVSKLLLFFKFPSIESDSQALLHWATAYLVVKLLMPIRIGLSKLL
jgi:hypothetical protein